MKNKYLILIIIILSFIAVFSSRKKSLPAFFNDDINLNVLDPKTKDITNLKLEEYVVGVVAAEMPASFNEEALKAQAIAARTYAFYKMKNTNQEYDVIADISNQAYITIEEMQELWHENFSLYYGKVKEAVDSTKNLIMTYNNEPIIAYYFAMSNGKTEEASLVFGESKNYLESVDSSWDEKVKNFIVEKEFTKEEFCRSLNLNCENNNININNINRSDTNRVNTIEINNKVYAGTEFRKLLTLRSTDFTIEVTDKVTITTKGYGHGVGMSQYGANEMAKLGHNYEEILKYYYQNIELKTINV